MTKKLRFLNLLLAMLLVSAILVVVTARGRGSSVPAQAQMPGADAQQLFKYITQGNPYKNWKNFPGQSGRYVHVNENPHGDWVAVYLNNEADQSIAYKSNPFQMRYGSIIVKENYSLLKGDPINQPPLNAVPVAVFKYRASSLGWLT